MKDVFVGTEKKYHLPLIVVQLENSLVKYVFGKRVVHSLWQSHSKIDIQKSKGAENIICFIKKKKENSNSNGTAFTSIISAIRNSKL